MRSLRASVAGQWVSCELMAGSFSNRRLAPAPMRLSHATAGE